MLKKIGILVAVLAAMMVLCGVMANAAEDDIASGTSGTCIWIIDAEGTLTIKPADGESGELADSVIWNSIAWYDYRALVKKLVVENGAIAAAESGYLFSGLTNCTHMDLSGLDTSNVVNMNWMIGDCEALQSIDFGTSFDTSNVTSMNSIFQNCTSLETLSLENGWDTSKVAGMSRLFYNCSSLTTVTFGDAWNTANVTEMTSMFDFCSSLKSVTFGEGWDTSKVTVMNRLFYGCKSLQSVTFGDNWNTPNLTGMNEMFYNCSSLESLVFGDGWDTSEVEYMGWMFASCKSLKSITFGNGWDTSKVTDMLGMFYGCSALETITVPAGFVTTKIEYTGFPTLPDIYTFFAADPSVPQHGQAFTEIQSGVAGIYEKDLVSPRPLTGSITTGTGTGEVTLRLLDTTGAEAATTSTSDATYTLSAPAGTYTLEVSKFNHVTRTYEVTISADTTLDVTLHLIGDVNGDGKVTIADYGKILNHCKRIVLLDGYALTCADVNNDGRVTIADYGKVLNHCKRIASLWEEEPEGDSGDSGGDSGDSGDGDGDGEVELPMIPA